jgi:hypothetical protein
MVTSVARDRFTFLLGDSDSDGDSAARFGREPQ